MDKVQRIGAEGLSEAAERNTRSMFRWLQCAGMAIALDNDGHTPRFRGDADHDDLVDGGES